jgi:hypothetical protein
MTVFWVDGVALERITEKWQSEIAGVIDQLGALKLSAFSKTVASLLEKFPI